MTILTSDVRRSFEAMPWLADASMFIDEQQVGAFYDAVVQPEGRQAKIVLQLEKYQDQQVEFKGMGKAKVSTSTLIKTLFPFLDAEVEVSGEAGEVSKKGKKQGETIEIHPIDTPQRRLVQLLLHYLWHFPERILIVLEDELEKDADWFDEEFVLAVPRALSFIDFPKGTKFIPMACEVEGGKVLPTFQGLETRTEKPPPAPRRGEKESRDDFLARRDDAWKEYWDWFDRTFSATAAMEIVEKTVSEEGRLEWIDYRVPVRGWSMPLHLHVSGRSKYSTGTFAYNLIKRGFNHGLRMVGTLKTKPDVNVLAIFEK